MEYQGKREIDYQKYVYHHYQVEIGLSNLNLYALYPLSSLPHLDKEHGKFQI